MKVREKYRLFLKISQPYFVRVFFFFFWLFCFVSFKLITKEIYSRTTEINCAQSSDLDIIINLLLTGRNELFRVANIWA